jgi:hypothetical protein
MHRPENPAVDRLEAVPNVRQRPADDDGHRVVEIRPAHLVFDIYLISFYCEIHFSIISILLGRQSDD